MHVPVSIRLRTVVTMLETDHSVICVYMCWGIWPLSIQYILNGQLLSNYADEGKQMKTTYSDHGRFDID